MQKRKLLIWMMIVALALASLAAAGCGGTAGAPADDHDAAETEHSDSETHEEGEAEETIPNDGAVIRILSPADGATFKTGDEILVEVEVENFPLGENGNHWHIRLNGEPNVMVVGGNLDQALRGLEPGEYVIGAYLSTGDHQDLEEGSEITVTVEE